MRFQSKISILVPSTFGENSPATREQLVNVRNSVFSQFCKHFGAYTFIRSSGGWENDESELIVERSIIAFAYSNLSESENEAIARQIAQYVRETLSQTCVLWAVESCVAGLEFA